MSNIDFSELIISKKGVITSERQTIGNIIGEKDDSIIVEKDGMSEHIYLVPKSKIEAYDGAQLILKVSEPELKTFEQRREKGVAGGESILEGITDKLGDVKDKVVDTTKDVAGKAKDKID
jgi:ABC-type Zn2+ transport system substrate-binding protein/surface adhesin